MAGNLLTRQYLKVFPGDIVLPMSFQCFRVYNNDRISEIFIKKVCF